jgi:hypothetical protein
MIGAVLMVLAFAIFTNWPDVSRRRACITILLVTAASYALSESPWYTPVKETLTEYGYEGLAPLLSIIILTRIKCRLSTCLMVLFCVAVSVNIAFWYAEYLGNEVEHIYDWVIGIAFAIQMALMLSTRITDDVHGMVHRPNRGVTGPILAFDHLDHCLTNNSSENQK